MLTDRPVPVPGTAPPAPLPRHAAPLRHQVLDALRTAIVEGRLVPGRRLIERELIAMYGVSRTVVREALRQLESEGLVETIAHRGPVVRELGAGEARELYAIRAALEGLAARLFATQASAAQRRELAAALAEVARAHRANDAGAMLAAKSRFYALLYEGAGSAVLSAMLATLHARIARWRRLGLTHPQRSRQRAGESLRELRAIGAAIRRRDADLAEALTRAEAGRAAAEVLRLLEREARPDSR
jgi:DNA-binding GntR family transcriptional regulator